MKKRFCALMAALVFSFCLAGSALAEEASLSYGQDDLFPYTKYERSYVLASSGILTEEETDSLDAQSQSIAASTNCGVYILAVEDFTVYGYDDLFEYAQDVYEGKDLGCGSGRDGVLLAVSTKTRDVSIAVHGDWANRAFTDYGRENVLYDAFLEDFSAENWYDGMVHYLDACASLLSQAQSGTPVDVPSETFELAGALGSAAAMCFLPAAIIAFVICGAMKKKMKTARKASGAAAYVSGNVDLKIRTDRYTHSTVLRTPIKQDNGPRPGGEGGSRGGTSVNSRGFSGSSRKF